MTTEATRAVLDEVGQYRIVPVIVLDRAPDAEPLANALLAAGLPLAEVTLRTPEAEDALARMAKIDGIIAGAGTVRTVDQVKRAKDAGAQFAVSPGVSERVIEACLDADLPLLPGVSCASDIHRATEAGFGTLKFFPAEASGGIPALKALSAPFNDVRFVPTGGISAKNLREYLDVPSVSAVGGSWMVAPALIRDGRFDEVERLCREAIVKTAQPR